MSFGYAVGDVIAVTQLAWNTVQNARKACGEHDELSREVLSLHVVLRRLEQEVEKPENPINDVESGDTHREELRVIFDGCKKVLNILDQVLTKYNALSERERSGRKLWQQIRFGNGKMTNLAEMRGKLTYYTSAMSLFLNMVSVGTMGRVERQMNNAGGDLREIKVAVNSITAHLMSKSTRHEGSILTAYADDDRAVWKEFRRELLEDGFSSSVIRKHKGLIKAYIEELGSRGLLDDEDPNDEAEQSPYCDVESTVEGVTAHDSNSQSESEAPPRLKAEDELPVRSEPPLSFNTKPEADSKAESGHKGTPHHDPISRSDSQPERKTDVLSDENNGKHERPPAEETRASEFEHESNSTATEMELDRGSDAGESPRGEFGPAREDNGTDNEAEKISDSCRIRSRVALIRKKFIQDAVAFRRNAMRPPSLPLFRKNCFREEQQDEETTRLFHDTWHFIRDNVTLNCIEWISLSMSLNDFTSLGAAWALIATTYLPELTIRRSKLPADLSVQQQGLISDLQSIQKAIEWFSVLIRRAEFPWPNLEAWRPEEKGPDFIFEVDWTKRNWTVAASTVPECALCPPS